MVKATTASGRMSRITRDQVEEQVGLGGAGAGAGDVAVVGLGAGEGHPVQLPVAHAGLGPAGQHVDQVGPVAGAGGAEEVGLAVDLEALPAGLGQAGVAAGAVAAEGAQPQADAGAQGREAGGEARGRHPAPQPGAGLPVALPAVVEGDEVELEAVAFGHAGEAVDLGPHRGFVHGEGRPEVVPVVREGDEAGRHRAEGVDVVPELLQAAGAHDGGRRAVGLGARGRRRAGRAQVAPASRGQVLRHGVLDAGEEPGAEQGLAQADGAGVVGHGLAGGRRAGDGEAVPPVQLHVLQPAPAAHLRPLADHAGAGVGLDDHGDGEVGARQGPRQAVAVVVDGGRAQVGVRPAPAPDGDRHLGAVEGDGVAVDLHGDGAGAAVDHVVDAGAAAGVDPHAGARASKRRSWLRARRRLWPGASILK